MGRDSGREVPLINCRNREVAGSVNGGKIKVDPMQRCSGPRTSATITEQKKLRGLISRREEDAKEEDERNYMHRRKTTSGET